MVESQENGMIKKLVKLLSCQHIDKKLVRSIPEYADPHCKLLGWNNTYSCPKCGEYIKEYKKFERNN